MPRFFSSCNYTPIYQIIKFKISHVPFWHGQFFQFYPTYQITHQNFKNSETKPGARLDR
jgi:hypothetical protein